MNEAFCGYGETRKRKAKKAFLKQLRSIAGTVSSASTVEANDTKEEYLRKKHL